MKRFVGVLAALALISCSGAEGPMGPPGPAGPQGAQGLPGPAGADGAANRLVMTTLVEGDGTAAVVLPLSVGTDINSPPSMACYHGSTADGVWLSVGSGLDGEPQCAVVFDDGGGWTAAMLNSVPGWVAAFVVVY